MTTKIGQMGQELSRTNPWWREPVSWASTDGDLRSAASGGLDYEPAVLGGLLPGGLYVLRGPRRVGKTVAVKQAVRRLIESGVPPRSIVSVAADGWAAKEIRTLVQNAALPPIPDGTHRYWFLDEITATTGPWDRQVKWLRDNDVGFRDAVVVLTGSDAAALTSAAGVLAGRRGPIAQADRTLLPMGFRSFCRILQDGLPDLPRVGLSEMRSPEAADAYVSLTPWLDDLVVLWERYLGYGGFPVAVAAAKRADPIPERFVDDLFDVIARDAFGRGSLSVTTTTSLIERLWCAMGAPANLSKIGADVGVGADVVARHVAYLRDAYLLWHCPQKHERDWAPRERAQDKLYAIDPIVARLHHLRSSSRRDIDPTVLTEMQLGVAVHRATYASGARWADDQYLFHVRTPARKEIDFVAECLAGVAIESKYVEDGRWRSEAATVDASRWEGLLVTRNVLDSRGTGAWAVPAGILAYLVDT